MQPAQAHAAPVRKKPSRPFVSSHHRPADDVDDGIFRVVLITSGSVASIKAPDIVGALVKSPNIDVQVVATKASTYFYSQEDVDNSVRSALNLPDGQTGEHFGVRVWTDEDEWSDWKQVGEPILHIELRRWADLVVIAPCSADLLAKIAGGICDSLATSLLRALGPSTPVIVCPAMNTYMYQHRLTTRHLAVVQEDLEYLVSGPQGAGRLACGDDGPGKMTDWRDIVSLIEGFATMHQDRRAVLHSGHPLQGSSDPPLPPPTETPPTPGRPSKSSSAVGSSSVSTQDRAPAKAPSDDALTGIADWRSMTNELGGDGTAWRRKWWLG
ncbi:phosphopantothenoylcysteine decarboxylase [Cryptococcus neoformans c45]|nr:phosphopantothenoylcysteine decarboxylase [Cryptococcus neoformans var. grubii c45]